MINLLFFARVVDLAKDTPTCIASLKPDTTPLGMRQIMTAYHPELSKALSEPQVLVSVHKMILKWHPPLFQCDESTFLPLFTGGYE